MGKKVKWKLWDVYVDVELKGEVIKNRWEKYIATFKGREVEIILDVKEWEVCITMGKHRSRVPYEIFTQRWYSSLDYIYILEVEDDYTKEN